MSETIKTSFILPKQLYLEFKKRALEEGRTVRELLIEAMIEYLSKPRTIKKRKRIIDIITKPISGAGPEDFKEYNYEDIGR